MKIRFLQHIRGSEDGLRVKEFAEGVAEDVADSLALAFIGMGAAERIDRETPEDGATDMETPENPRRGRKPKAGSHA